MVSPSSDDWLSRGFVSGQRICIVETLIYFQTWTDESGACVGVTIDYEYANDLHFDLDRASWLAFLRATGVDGGLWARTEDLSEVLLREGYSSFENTLIRLRLPYTRWAF